LGQVGRAAQGQREEAEERRKVMAVYKQPKSKNWWYKFMWNGDLVRESTKQTNKRVAEQMEAAHRTALAKGEVGIRDRKPIPTLKEFAERDFLPFVRATFAAKQKTLAYYENGVARLLAFERLAGERLDAITSDRIAEYIATRQLAKGKRGCRLQVASLNRELQALRACSVSRKKWGRVERTLPNVKMLPGEKHRERVLNAAEEDLYFRGASTEAMTQYADPAILRDVATILLVTSRVKAILDMRLSKANRSAWVSLLRPKVAISSRPRSRTTQQGYFRS
jgi:hypothetical protein